MNIGAKITALTYTNKISIGEDIYKLLHPTIQSEFHELDIEIQIRFTKLMLSDEEFNFS
jgi:hypothetical protein